MVFKINLHDQGRHSGSAWAGHDSNYYWTLLPQAPRSWKQETLRLQNRFEPYISLLQNPKVKFLANPIERYLMSVAPGSTADVRIALKSNLNVPYV